eukprot:4186540-Amphidinium_carterae.1
MGTDAEPAQAGVAPEAGGAGSEQRALPINQWQAGQKTYQRKVSKMLRVLNSVRRRERVADRGS